MKSEAHYLWSICWNIRKILGKWALQFAHHALAEKLGVFWVFELWYGCLESIVLERQRERENVCYRREDKNRRVTDNSAWRDEAAERNAGPVWLVLELLCQVMKYPFQFFQPSSHFKYSTCSKLLSLRWVVSENFSVFYSLYFFPLFFCSFRGQEAFELRAMACLCWTSCFLASSRKPCILLPTGPYWAGLVPNFWFPLTLSIL